MGQKTTDSGKRIPGALIVRPAYEIALFGGPETVHIRIGTMVRVNHTHNLFMQGVRYAEVRRVRDVLGTIVLDVRPYIGGTPCKGKLRELLHTDILIDENGLGV